MAKFKILIHRREYNMKLLDSSHKILISLLVESTVTVG